LMVESLSSVNFSKADAIWVWLWNHPSFGLETHIGR
jgi:hypothetical protein